MQFGKHTYIFNLIEYFSLAHGTAPMQLQDQHTCVQVNIYVIDQAISFESREFIGVFT